MEPDSQNNGINERKNTSEIEINKKESKLLTQQINTLKIVDDEKEQTIEEEEQTEKAGLTDGLGTKKVKEFHLDDTSNYSVNERNALFQRGLDFEKETDKDNALQCYLGCIKGLTQKTNFVLLPQCLHSIADLYRDKGDYQNAIHFAQAEKMFYETALIDSGEIQQKLETAERTEENGATQDSSNLDVESLRAEEYEHLAQLCMDKNQSQLALEYAGKCTKIRQKIYGDNHEKTQSSLNMFAEVYAQVGKLQYTDSVALLDAPIITSDVPPEGAPKEGVDSLPNGSEPVSILRQRSVVDLSESTHEIAPDELMNTNDDSDLDDIDREKKRVSFHKSVDESIKEREKEHKDECLQHAIVFSFLVCLVMFISNFTD